MIDSKTFQLSSYYQHESIYCALHEKQLCKMICTYQKCHKNGLICSKCPKTSYHNKHINSIIPYQQAYTHLKDELKYDNFTANLKQIEFVQQQFSVINNFFINHHIPAILSFENQYTRIKEQFWSQLLTFGSGQISQRLEKIQPLEKNTDEQNIQNLINFLAEHGLTVARLYKSNIRDILNNFMNKIINQAIQQIKNHVEFVKKLEQNLVEIPQSTATDFIYSQLMTQWKLKQSIKLHHRGITKKRCYSQFLIDVKDNQHFVYFDWKFIYLYNYKEYKVKNSIETADEILGLCMLEGTRKVVSMHYGEFMYTYGIQVWDIDSGEKVEQYAEGFNVYDLIYIKKYQKFIFVTQSTLENEVTMAILDIKSGKMKRKIYVRDFSVMEDMFLKFLPEKDLLVLIVTSGESYPTEQSRHRLYTYSMISMKKVHYGGGYLPYFTQLERQNLQLQQNVQNKSRIISTKGDCVITYQPGTSYPIQVLKLDQQKQQGVVLHSSKYCQELDCLLLGSHNMVDYQQINSIVLYDCLRGKPFGVIQRVAYNNILAIEVFSQGDLIVCASFDSQIHFFTKQK